MMDSFPHEKLPAVLPSPRVSHTFFELCSATSENVISCVSDMAAVDSAADYLAEETVLADGED